MSAELMAQSLLSNTVKLSESQARIKELEAQLAASQTKSVTPAAAAAAPASAVAQPAAVPPSAASTNALKQLVALLSATARVAGTDDETSKTVVDSLAPTLASSPDTIMAASTLLNGILSASHKNAAAVEHHKELARVALATHQAPPASTPSAVATAAAALATGNKLTLQQSGPLLESLWREDPTLRPMTAPVPATALPLTQPPEPAPQVEPAMPPPPATMQAGRLASLADAIRRRPVTFQDSQEEEKRPRHTTDVVWDQQVNANRTELARAQAGWGNMSFRELGNIIGPVTTTFVK